MSALCLNCAPLTGERITYSYGRRCSPAICQGGGHFSSDFSLRYRTTDLGRFHLRIPGRHNVLNSMAAIAVALELEVKPDIIREALATFSGGNQETCKLAPCFISHIIRSSCTARRGNPHLLGRKGLITPRSHPSPACGHGGRLNRLRADSILKRSYH